MNGTPKEMGGTKTAGGSLVATLLLDNSETGRKKQ